MNDHTTEIESSPPSSDLPSLGQLHAILERVPHEPSDPRQAREVAYHLNRQRAVVSHSSRALQEMELTTEDLHEMRKVLIRRNQRIVAEIEDIDRAIKGHEAAIAALRSGG